MATLTADPIDLPLNTLTGDLDIVGGKITMTSGVAAVIQGVRIRMLMVAGEWFLNLDAGTRWFERDGVLDRAGRVIYIGTFSKMLFPSLRLGYLVAPPDLAATFRTARALADRQSPLVDQAVLTAFMRDGHFDYGNGYHGRVYLNPHQLFRHPSTIWRLAQDLLDILPEDLLTRTEVVAGPSTGGALLAHTLAGLLDSRRQVSEPPKLFAPFAVDAERDRALRSFYRTQMAGKRVLLADDVPVELGHDLAHLVQGPDGGIQEVLDTAVRHGDNPPGDPPLAVGRCRDASRRHRSQSTSRLRAGSAATDVWPVDS